MTPRKPARTNRKVAAVINTRKEVVPDNSGQRQVRRRNTKPPRALKPKATGAGRDLWEGVVAAAVKRKLSPQERVVMDGALRRSVKVIAKGKRTVSKAERVAGRIVTIIDGCSVHGDRPMTDSEKSAMSEVIKAAREKFSRFEFTSRKERAR